MECSAKLLSIAAIMLAFASAVLWFLSAKGAHNFPDPGLSGSTDEVADAIRRQSLFNACAAVVTGLSALCQAAAMVLTL